MPEPVPPLEHLLGRTFLPTWIATALLIAVQMANTALFYEPADPRPMMATADSTILGLVVLGSGIAVWAFRGVRPMSLLIGSMIATLVALQHTVLAPHTARPPPEELFAFYTVAAVLLAAGAVLEARRR